LTAEPTEEEIAVGEIVRFASNGGEAEGYLALPAVGSGPGVVVIQEWWGLVPHITDLCERFASAGLVALAPDLYHGAATTEPDEAAKLMMALNLEQAAKDLSGAVAEVARKGNGKVGVVGFCMGGGLALMLAANAGDAVQAVVPFYGAVPWESASPDYANMSAAVQGHFAEKDDWVNAEMVATLDTTLRENGVEFEAFTYPGTDHAFFNDARSEVYDAEAAGLAWRRTLEFLKSKLG